jgi:HD superfamily phosphohydrolase YqeK
MAPSPDPGAPSGSSSGTGAHSGTGPLPDSGAGPIHPLVAAASQGVLPDWAKARERRRRHMARVSALLGEWAIARREAPEDVMRWMAAGHLHDALRDEDEDVLRGMLDAAFRELPGKVLHGPGVARRLREEGVEDEELLHALAFHTLGSPAFGDLGMALFAADFLEPGRTLREDWRGELRRRAPGDLEGVVREILSARIRYLVEELRPLHPGTVAFWNRMAEGQTWASASEV